MFLLLNLVFFSSMFYFVYSAKDGALAYEQIYSKQTALLLDSAYPGMVFTINFNEGYSLAGNVEKNSSLLKLDESSHSVIVSLRSSGGYSVPYFSDYKFKWRVSYQKNQITV
jgi:hypothetical protein